MMQDILDRLAKWTAENGQPGPWDMNALFVDIGDAHQAIIDLNEFASQLQRELDVAKATAVAAVGLSPDVAHVKALLEEAKERLSVHALSTVGERIMSALNILEG